MWREHYFTYTEIVFQGLEKKIFPEYRYIAKNMYCTKVKYTYQETCTNCEKKILIYHTLTLSYPCRKLNEMIFQFP